MQEILLFTDGASKGNPGRGGWGAIVAGDGKVVELGGAQAHTTNNRMELVAALRGLQYAKQLPAGPRVLRTDSNYVINGITKWVAGWQKNGWKTKEKKDVLNKDLWMDLAEAAHGQQVAWEYVGGHVGIAGNERVDAIASDFALGKDVQLYKGPIEGYGVDITNLSHDVVLKERKSSTRERTTTKAYSYISEVGGVVLVHKSWPECAARVKGKRARFKKAISKSEETDIVAQFSR
ncbi:MAG TPA: ribonuclease H [Candidatus Paceibacterota bacterium]|jgi:ribonuclease HI|nr:ribonuclease H [Candidatus Paceibacterota bacterium]